MSILESRATEVAATASLSVLDAIDTGQFFQDTKEQGYESFAGVIYFEGRDVTIGALLRIGLNITPQQLIGTGWRLGPYITSGETGQLNRYTGVMLYREVEDE